MEVTIQSARRIINALKNGVVPDENLEYLCIARENELKEIQRCFDITRDEGGIVKFFSGKYGTGKSFLMNTIKQKALEQNFIVSKLQIDKGFKFNNLEYFYYYLMHNLSSKEAAKYGTSFQDIFDEWIKKLQNMTDRGLVTKEIQSVIAELNRFNASFARAFLTYIRARISKETELSNAAASWLTGEKNIPASIKAKFEVIGNINRVNSIDFFKAFIKLVKMMGYSGVIVLIDEIELIMNERSDIRRASYENIRYIIDICCSGELNGCAFIMAGTDEFYENEEKGIKTYQALSQRLGDAIDKNHAALADLRQPVMPLRNPKREEFLELTKRIISIYSRVYEFSSYISVESIMSWTLLSCKKLGPKSLELSMREYLTKLIEVLDIMEQNPDNKVFKAELKTIPNKG